MKVYNDCPICGRELTAYKNLIFCDTYIYIDNGLGLLHYDIYFDPSTMKIINSYYRFLSMTIFMGFNGILINNLDNKKLILTKKVISYNRIRKLLMLL